MQLQILRLTKTFLQWPLIEFKNQAISNQLIDAGKQILSYKYKQNGRRRFNFIAFHWPGFKLENIAKFIWKTERNLIIL